MATKRQEQYGNSSISMLKGDYIKMIEKYDFDYFLVNRKYPINTYLGYSDDYEVLLDNKDTIISLQNKTEKKTVKKVEKTTNEKSLKKNKHYIAEKKNTKAKKEKKENKIAKQKRGAQK